MVKISVKKACLFGCNSLINHWKEFRSMIFKMLPIVALLSFVSACTELWLTESWHGLVYLILVLLLIWLYCPLYISAFQFFLRKKQVDSNYFQHLFAKETIKYWWLIIKSAPIATLIAILVIIILEIFLVDPFIAEPETSFFYGLWLVICFSGLLLILLTRFSLAFPSAALKNYNKSFRWSHRILKGHTWSVLLTLMTIYFPVIILMCLDEVFDYFIGTNNLLLLLMHTGISSLIDLFLTIPIIAAVAYIYSEIVENKSLSQPKKI